MALSVKVGFSGGSPWDRAVRTNAKSESDLLSRPSLPEPLPITLRLLLVLAERLETGVLTGGSDLGQSLSLSPATMARLLELLEAQEFLAPDGQGGYRATPRLIALRRNPLAAPALRARRRVILQHLSTCLGETCIIVIPDGAAMLYLDRVETDWPLSFRLASDARVPLHCTAAGKLYLSSLPDAEVAARLGPGPYPQWGEQTVETIDDLIEDLQEIRTRGYAVGYNEFLTGMAAIALPVIDDQGRWIAAVSSSTLVVRLNRQRLLSHIPNVREAAQALAGLVASGGAA